MDAILIAGGAGAALAFLLGSAIASRAVGAWAALLVAGQAASLRLVDAGPVVGYQHLRLSAELGDERFALGILVIQGILVAAGLVRSRSDAGTLLRSIPKPLLAVVLVAAAAFAVAPSADPGTYAAEVAFGAGLRLAAIANVLVLVLAVPDDLADRIARRLKRRQAPGSRPRADRFALSLSVAVTAVCALLAVFVYERHPHVPDEVSYLLHARYLAAGEMAMPAPPVPGAFDVDLMRYEPDRWYSPVPPGWPAVLATGVLVGAPWMVNPVLAGLGILLSYLLVWRIFDRRTARVAAPLLAASPWYLFLGMSFMTHLTSFVLAVAAADAVARWRRSGRLAGPLLAGALAGAVGLVRPLEAIMVGGLLGLVIVWPGRRRRRAAATLAFGLGAVAVSAIVLPYNAHLTGSPTEFPIMAYTEALYGPGTNALGFGGDRGLGWTGLDPFPGHGARDIVVNSVLNAHAIDIELLGWATGAWIFVAGAVLLRRPGGTDWWMIGAVALPVALHAFYWFAGGPDFGARYWFLVILPLVVLIARGLLAAVSLRPGAAAGAAALVLAALATFVPWRAVDKYAGYRGMRPWTRPLAADPDLANALILVRGDRHPDYASAAVYNPLDLRSGGPVFAWDRDPATRDSVLAAYPERSAWLVEPPTDPDEPARPVPLSTVPR